MADNLTVTNQKTTFDANTNTDLPVRTTEITGGEHIQHVRLDLGSGISESVAVSTVPVSGTITANAGTNLNTSALATESTLISVADQTTTISDNTSNILARTPALGQTTMAGSSPVVIASNQSAVPISASSLPLPSGAATSAAQLPNSHDVTIDNASGAAAVNVQDGGNSLTVDNTVLSVVGGGTEATAQRVTIASDSTGVLSVDDNGGSLTVDAVITPFSTIGTGSVNVTSAGTRVALAGSTACKRVVITAKAANTGVIWVGGSTVASGSGIPLVALQQIEIDIANLTTVNIDSTVNGDGVTFLYYN